MSVSLQGEKGKGGWGKLALKVLGAYLLLNILLFPSLVPAGNWSSLFDGNALTPLILLGTVGIFLYQGGVNLIRTGMNSAEARFSRRPGNTSGSFIYDVQPARHSWVNFALMVAILMIVGILATAVPLTVVLLPIFMALVLPVILRGAKYRKPVELTVSPEGLSNGTEHWRAEEIAAIEIDKSLDLADGPIVATAGGVPTSTLIGRAVGRRQAERTYLLKIRREGSSSWTVLAGGLTLGCADSLLLELGQAMDLYLVRQAA